MRYFLPLLLLCVCGCNSDRLAKLEKQNQEIRAELDRQKKIVDLDTQVKCSEAAKVYFTQHWTRDKSTLLLDYTNHYNVALGKCFILTEWHYRDINGAPGEWFNNIWLYDVFENNQFASFAAHTGIDQKPFASQPTVLTCRVDNVDCKTIDEFQQKTGHYMTN